MGGADTLDLPGELFEVTESPAKEANLALKAQAANRVFAGPESGAPAAPTARLLVDADIPAAIARDTEVATAVSDHAAAGDPHTGYQKESEREAASGYAGLNASSRVIKNPASASAIPVAYGIPTASAAGKLADGWHPQIASGDLHTEYQRESEKGAAGGYATLNVAVKVPDAQITSYLLVDIPFGTQVRTYYP
jgi:hypothetical protein